MSTRALVLVLIASLGTAAQAQRPANAPPLVPVRLAVEGNFRIAPPYSADPAFTEKPNVPKGRVIRFTLNSAESRIFPTGPVGRGGRPGGPGQAAQPPAEPPQHQTFERQVAVYVPAGYVAEHTGAVHRRAGRTVVHPRRCAARPGRQAADRPAVHARDARQLDPREAHPAHRGGAARAGPRRTAHDRVRHGVGSLRELRRDRSAAADHAGLSGRLHDGPGGTRDAWRKLGSGSGADDGVAPPQSVSPRHQLLGHVRGAPAQRHGAQRRLGLSPDVHPGFRTQAAAHLAARERERPRRRHARGTDAELGGRRTTGWPPH